MPLHALPVAADVPVGAPGGATIAAACLIRGSDGSRDEAPRPPDLSSRANGEGPALRRHPGAGRDPALLLRPAPLPLQPAPVPLFGAPLPLRAPTLPLLPAAMPLFSPSRSSKRDNVGPRTGNAAAFFATRAPPRRSVGPSSGKRALFWCNAAGPRRNVGSFTAIDAPQTDNVAPPTGIDAAFFAIDGPPGGNAAPRRRRGGPDAVNPPARSPAGRRPPAPARAGPGRTPHAPATRRPAAAPGSDDCPSRTRRGGAGSWSASFTVFLCGSGTSPDNAAANSSCRSAGRRDQQPGTPLPWERRQSRRSQPQPSRTRRHGQPTRPRTPNPVIPNTRAAGGGICCSAVVAGARLSETTGAFVGWHAKIPGLAMAGATPDAAPRTFVA